jgi:hypothetical protein
MPIRNNFASLLDRPPGGGRRLAASNGEKAVTVYITQEVPGRDLSDALEFGDLDILLPAKEQVSLSSMPTVRRMQRKLVRFTSDDYLVLSGDPVCIGIACCLAALANNGRFKVLKWDRIEARYYPIEVDLFQETRR